MVHLLVLFAGVCAAFPKGQDIRLAEELPQPRLHRKGGRTDSTTRQVCTGESVCSRQAVLNAYAAAHNLQLSQG